MVRRASCAFGLVLAVSGCTASSDEDEDLGWISQEIESVCADDQVIEGIDVSYYQGTVDWASVAGDGVRFGIARVNHGGFMDPEFENNWQGMKDNGVLRGAYQYFNPGDDPVEQANVLIDKVGLLGPGDLPAVIDVESTDGQSGATIAANVATWIDLVTAGTGRAPVIYTGPYFWQDNVGSADFVEHPLWIAHYTNNCPLVPDAWRKWRMWQYTSSGSVAGIGGDVDRNRYNGSLDQLQDFAANGWRAEVVSLVYPEVLEAGASSEVVLELRNAGWRTWTENTRLGTTEPRDRESGFANGEWYVFGTRAAAVSGEVASGATVTLTFNITAPDEPGLYTEHFNLVEEGVAWFSDIVPGGGPADDAMALTIEVTPSSSETAGVGGGSGSGNAGAGGGSSSAAPEDCVPDESCSYAVPRRGGGGWLLALAAVALGAARRRRARA